MSRRRASGPVAFMPSDGKYLGSRDLKGIPVVRNGERMRIRIRDVWELTDEKILGRTSKPFWSMEFDRPPHAVLLDPSLRAGGWEWEKSSKEWKFGRTVCERLEFRVGDDATYWPGAIIPIRLEITNGPSGGRVYCIRPVPLSWELDDEKREKAMRLLIQGKYRPPGLDPEMLARFDEDHPDLVPSTFGTDNETTTEDDHADADLGG